MRCFTKVLTVSWCLLFASLLGAPTANAADGGRDASSAKVSSDRNAAQPLGTAQQTAAERYGDLPLSFEANQGQTDRQVRFLSRGSGYSFFLTQAGAVLTFSSDSHSDAAVLRMQLAGASPTARIQGLDELPGKSNYFFGSDSRRWRTGVPTFSKVAYENVYPGISLVYYGNQRQLEYDFVVAPGADPRQIRLSVAGAQKLTVDAHGNLVLRSAAGEVQLLAPKVYQQIGGQKQEIAGEWKLEGNSVAGFRLGAYDRTRALVIDPVLMYSSFLGGTQKNALSKITIDAAGNAYVAGYTASGDFPAAPTPQAMTFGSGTPSRGAFVAKIDPSGSNLLYSTYLSGSVDEEATGLAVDTLGNVYVAGNTHSTDFPTRNALQSTCATHTQAGTCSSAFLTKISPTGDALLFSTYLGGSGGDSARSLALDATGSAYVAGVTSSVDFPVTAGAAQTKCGGACQQNAFVAKFSASGNSLAYASYLGGSGVDDAADLAVDSAGNVYVAGRTTSVDFPLSTPFQSACTPDATSSSAACIATAFVAKIKADGSAFAYSTYLGGSLGSHASAIAVDSLGSAYVTGSTQSADFPLQKPFQKSCGIDATSHLCSVDVFLTKFAPTGKALVYSTYLGGSGRDEASGIVVDATGNAHIVGRTESADFPTVASLQSKLKGASDAFVARFNAAGSALTFSTYHGGSATESGNGITLDAKGNVYITGETASPDFPTNKPFQSSCAGACTSAFVTKMSALPPATAPTITSPASASFLGGTGAPASSFTVTTTGTLPITIDDGGATLPAGLAFAADSATGTATISGTPTANTTSTTPITLTATNTTGNNVQTFTLSVCPGTITGLPALNAVNADGLSGGTFNVNMSSGTCAWSSSADQSWLTISGSGTGAGSGTFSVGNFTNAGAATSRTGNLFIVGSSFPVRQLAAAVSITSAPTLVEVSQTGSFTAIVNNVTVANQGVTWTLSIGGSPCSPGCGTLNSATANPVTYTAPASVDPANPPGPVTINATSAFDTTQSASVTFTITDYTISVPASATVVQNQSVSPSPTLSGAAFSSDGYTGTLTFGCTVAPTPANAPTCSVPGSITIPGSLTTPATISTVGATPTGPYTVTFTATDARGISHVKTLALTVSPAPVLSVVKAHTVTFTQGGTGTWTVVVSNTMAGSTTTSGLTVTDTLPTGYSLTSSSGTNWSCGGTNAVTCTSTSTVAGGAAYPTLILNVSIPANSPISVSNTATASLGGALVSASGSDNNVPVTQVPANLTATSGANQSVPVGNNFAAFAATVTDAAAVPVPNVSVTFTAPSTGATCGFGGVTTTTVSSDSSGVATTTVSCTANTTSGNYSIQASVTTAGVPKPTFAIKNTDFSIAFAPLSADVAPGNAPAGVTLTATAINGYAPTSLTVTSCVVTSGPTPVPTCSISSPITVGTPAPVTLTTTGSPAGIYTVQATVHDSSTTQVTHTAPTPFTLNLVQVTISTAPPSTVEVNQTVPFAGSTAGLVDTTVNWSLVGTSCTGVACGSFSSVGPNTSTNYLSPASTASGVAVALKATSNGDNTFSAVTPGSVPITDYSVALPTPIVAIAQSNPGATGTSTLSASAINGYAGTVNNTACTVAPATALGPAPTCSAPAPAVPGSSAVSITTQPTTPTGLYSFSVQTTDSASNPQTRTAASQPLAVNCTFNLGSPNSFVPVFTPATSAAPNTFSFGVAETVGGGNCAWGNKPVVNSTINAASVDGNVVTSLDTTGDVLTAVNGFSKVTITVGAIPLSGVSGKVTVPYFNPAAAGNSSSLILPVGREAAASVSVVKGGTISGFQVTATQAATGTLNIPNANLTGITTVCGVVDSNGKPDVNNFGITCTAAPSAGGFLLSVSLPAASAASASRFHDRGAPPILYALAMGFPAIFFLSAGASAFAPKRRKRGFNRVTCTLGILLILSLLVLLPACGGGFKATFITPSTNTYALTVMGYVTDAGNNVVGMDVFTVLLTIN